MSEHNGILKYWEEFQTQVISTKRAIKDAKETWGRLHARAKREVDEIRGATQPGHLNEGPIVDIGPRGRSLRHRAKSEIIRTIGGLFLGSSMLFLMAFLVPALFVLLVMQEILKIRGIHFVPEAV